MDAGRDDPVALMKSRDLDRVVAKGFDGYILQGQGLILADDPDLGRAAGLIDGRERQDDRIGGGLFFAGIGTEAVMPSCTPWGGFCNVILTS